METFVFDINREKLHLYVGRTESMSGVEITKFVAERLDLCDNHNQTGLQSGKEMDIQINLSYCAWIVFETIINILQEQVILTKISSIFMSIFTEGLSVGKMKLCRFTVPRPDIMY